jgi:hypothetical protein
MPSKVLLGDGDDDDGVDDADVDEDDGDGITMELKELENAEMMPISSSSFTKRVS